MDEIVRAFNFVINQGWAYYWATSEWSAQQLEEAYRAWIYTTLYSSKLKVHRCEDVATALGLSGPIAEQCQHQWVLCDHIIFYFGLTVPP